MSRSGVADVARDARMVASFAHVGDKLMQFASMAKAALTRTPPAKVGEHGSFTP